MTIPGGMTTFPTWRALTVRLPCEAAKTLPATSANTVSKLIATSWARVTANAGSSLLRIIIPPIPSCGSSRAPLASFGPASGCFGES